MKFSVVIPTYNRKRMLRENLERMMASDLCESLSEVVVLDNCSDYDVEFYLKDIIENSWFNLRVVKNPGNISLVGNSLRALEVSVADYIWTLCDDDFIAPGALNEIEEAIVVNDYPIFLWMPIKGGPINKRPGKYKNFYESVRASPNLFFVSLSCCIFKREEFLAYLKYGYLYAYSWIPFIAPLIARASTIDDSIYIGEKYVAEVQYRSNEQKWSKLDVCLGIWTILELPSDELLREEIRKSINKFIFSTERLFIDSVQINEKLRWELFGIFLNRRYQSEGLKKTMWKGIFCFSKRLPFVSMVIIRIAEKILGRKLLLKVEDRYGRS